MKASFQKRTFQCSLPRSDLWDDVKCKYVWKDSRCSHLDTSEMNFWETICMCQFVLNRMFGVDCFNWNWMTAMFGGGSPIPIVDNQFDNKYGTWCIYVPLWLHHILQLVVEVIIQNVQSTTWKCACGDWANTRAIIKPQHVTTLDVSWWFSVALIQNQLMDLLRQPRSTTGFVVCSLPSVMWLSASTMRINPRQGFAPQWGQIALMFVWSWRVHWCGTKVGGHSLQTTFGGIVHGMVETRIQKPKGNLQMIEREKKLYELSYVFIHLILNNIADVLTTNIWQEQNSLFWTKIGFSRSSKIPCLLTLEVTVFSLGRY